MDDLLCFSDLPEQHLTHLRTIFTKFRTAKLKVKLSKSDFFKQELEFLGHKLGPNGISPADDKKLAIDRIKPPTNVWEVRSLRVSQLLYSYILRIDMTHDEVNS